MKLRDYQQACIDKLRLDISKGENRLLVKAPCSFGKTIVFCSIAKSAYLKGKKTMILIDSVALITQTVEKLKRFVDDVGIYCATLKKKDSKMITVASIQSIKEIDTDLLIVDEAHGGVKRWEKLLDGFDGITIGFTATPFTAKGVAMYGDDKFFKKLNYEMSVHELISRGILTPMRYGTEKEETKISLKDVAIVNGDYSEADLQRVYSLELDKVDLQIEDMLKRTQDRKKIIVMCTGIKHAEYVAARLPGASAYHSGQEQGIRAQILKDFEHKDIRFLVGVTAIYKGLDITCVDCLANMRPSRSYPFFIQFAGRGVRLHAGKKDCLFLDYGQTVETLGFYEEFRERPKKDSRHKIAPEYYPKKCPSCLALVRPQIIYCDCGHVFEVDKTKNLTVEPYVHRPMTVGVVKSISVSETYYFWPTFARILVKLENGQDIEFLYAKKLDWVMKKFSAHKEALTPGKTIKWKVERHKNSVYYNLVSIL